jgi:L-2-amino-thiazoline-4-carboxylic acid hydrolase
LEKNRSSINGERISMLHINRLQIERAKDYQKKGEAGLLGENDWIMSVEEEKDGSIYRQITECAAHKVLNRAGSGSVFPCTCRIDYLMANIGGMRIERNKTIGDGDSICENHIFGPGYTEWAPEKGFIDRK